ncbi:MAG TPA: nucleotidyltransferase domain-containing protein [Myxococcota bacterium]|nr:nucleotidyltransferase domain-containing protein [Myxococcota bacterium]
MAALPELARALRALGAQRVWVFGSVEDGSFDDGSDLDLAVHGLPPERFLAARVAVTDRVPVEVDLVELERAPASLRAHILATGRELGDVG